MATTDRYLRDICELLIDSRLGYGDAAGRANDPRLHDLLAGIGETRLAMIANVSNRIGHMGAPVPHNGTFKGTIHRAWMAIRDLLSNTHDVNMIAECHRGESYLIGKYDAALRDGALPEDVRTLLSGQRVELMANLMEIRSLDSVLSDA